MAVPGIFASHQGIVGTRTGDFASSILRINPMGTAPMLALSSGMPDESAQDTTVSWFEENHISGRTNCVSGGTTTTVVVGDGSSYTPGTILLVEETAEIIYVTASVSNTLTVARGLSGTTIVAITGSHNVQNIGNAFEEGAGRPSAVSNQGYPRANLTQIFRNGWAITGTAKAVQWFTGSQVAKNKGDCAIFHAEDQERAMMFGKKHLGTVNNKQFRLMDGLLTQMAQYGGTIQAAGGSTTQAQLRDFLRRVFTYNVRGAVQERIAFTGNLGLQILNEAARMDAVYNIEEGTTKFGLKFTKFGCPFGDINVMTHPLMTENPNWTKDLHVFHPGGIKKKTLRPTFPENYDSNGVRILGQDADEGALTTETSICCMAASTMGSLTGITSAAKSPVV
jgi:Family of unknown function (DUF5309)